MSIAAPCTWTLDRIEAYIDGELDDTQALQLDEHVAACPTCSEQLAQARSLADALRSLPQLTYPAEAVNALQREIRQTRRRRLGAYTRRLSAVAAVLLALLGGYSLLDKDQPPPAVESVEVAQARRQVEWTLAYLGNLGNRTGTSIRDDVIQPRLVDPLRQSLETILPAQNL
ncbi:MAG: hypothetical protein GKR89_08950 [Candidatus Latescibacteria bacterium]|nr:hypothetical protein [Candidatus Latescibacterota bacterium]